jgi:hypothetical protein
MALPVDVNDSTAEIEENRTVITREMGGKVQRGRGAR